MNKNIILINIDEDIKERINYLVYKDKFRKGNITLEDLEKAYQYSKMNVRLMEESKTVILELILLEKYEERKCDMKIIDLYNRYKRK
jgi:hypothetical protein